MNYEQFLELDKTRSSTRSYKLDLVSSEQLEKILEAARWAQEFI